LIDLYTKNHIVQTGITDLITLVKLVGKKENINIQSSNNIENKVVLFIDEFSSVYEIIKLMRIKSKKNLKYILICTEFETNTFNGKSFNEFNPLNRVDSIIVNILSYLLLIIPKNLRGNKLIGKVTAFFLLPFVLLRLLFYRTLNKIILIDNIKILKRSIYMKARWIGYNKFSKHVDMFLKIHPLLNDNKDLVLYPFYEGIKKVKNNNIKVSGTQTSYRINRCFEFNQKLKLEKPRYDFKFNGKINFDIVKKDKKFGFAYQPAQSSSWNKSNPIKIWRDFFFHDAISIVDRKFDDHVIENITLTKEDFFSNNDKKLSIERKQKEYLSIALKYNNVIFRQIKQMIED